MLYLFIHPQCWWTFQLFLSGAYYWQCCYEHFCSCLFISSLFRPHVPFSVILGQLGRVQEYSVEHWLGYLGSAWGPSRLHLIIIGILHDFRDSIRSTAYKFISLHSLFLSGHYFCFYSTSILFPLSMFFSDNLMSLASIHWFVFLFSSVHSSVLYIFLIPKGDAILILIFAFWLINFIYFLEFSK